MKKIVSFALLLALCGVGLHQSASAQAVLVGEYQARDTMTTFRSIASTGTRIQDLEGDDVAWLLTMPFTVSFGNERYSQLNISSNGQIAMGTSNPVRSNYNNNTGTMSILVPLGHDLDISSTNGNGRVYWKTEGSAPNREVVVEYNRVSPYGAAAFNRYTFQVRVHENGNIAFVYDTCVASLSRGCFCFIREHSAQSFISATGRWDNLVLGTQQLLAITTDSTNVPRPGQCIEFIRPDVRCARPYALTVDTTTTTSATISWSDSSATTSWSYEYDVTGFVRGTGTRGTSQSRTVTINNLLPQTSYTVYVHGECGGTGSAWVPVSFRTQCVDIAHSDLPYVDKFDDYTEGATGGINPCWTRYYGTSTTSYPYAVSEQAWSGTNSLKFFANRTLYSYVILPMVQDAVNTLQLTFRMYGTTTTSGLVIGVCDDRTGDGTFVPVDTIRARAANRWDEYEVSLASYNGTGHYVCIKQFLNNSASHVVYLDNLMLHTIPTCFRPLAFRAESVEKADSVVLSWTNSSANISAWDIAYGPVGFDPDTVVDNMVSGVWDTIYEFNNLQGGMRYEAYVRSSCSDGYSLWMGPISFVPGSYIMRPAAVGSATQTITMCGGAVYDDGGPDGNYSTPSSSSAASTVIIYPSTDSLLTIQGTVSCYNSSSYGLYIYDGAGMGGTLLGHWYGNNQTIPRMVSTQGPMTINFIPGTYSTTYAGLELLVGCEAMPPCSPVSDVEVVRAPTAAYCTWRLLNTAMGMPASYEVELIDSIGNVQSISTMDAEAHFTGLSVGEPYLLRVQPVCDDGTYLEWDSTLFRTQQPLCSQVSTTETISVGNGTNTSYYMPVNNYYNYSITEQLIMASEFDTAACDIVGIGFQYAAANPSTAKNNVRIYMALSNTTMLSGWLPITSQTLVYSGPLNARNGWNYYMFNEAPFHYDGQRNVIVTVEDLSGSANGSSYTFYTHSASNRAVYYYSNTGAVGTSGSHYSYSYRNNMKFMKCGMNNGCAAPRVITQNISATDASLLWLPGNTESSWDVSYRATGEPTWTTAATATTSTSITLQNLRPNTAYEVRVSHTCQGTNYTGAATFTTPCTPSSIPFSESFEMWGSSGSAAAPACWRKIYNTTSTSYMPYSTTSYTSSGSRSLYLGSLANYYSGIVLPQMTAPLDSLMLAFSLYRPDTNYEHSVIVGTMSDANDFSTFRQLHTATAPSRGWHHFELPLTAAGPIMDRIAIITPQSLRSMPYIDDIEVDYYRACQRPVITATSTSSDSVYLSWQGDPSASFEVEYGPHGFAHGAGTTEFTGTDTSLAVGGLQPATVYDFYVRATCDGGDMSNWSFLATVTTQCGAMPLPIDEDFDSWPSRSVPMCWHCAIWDGTSYQTGSPVTVQLTSGGVYVTSALYFNSSGAGQMPFAMLPAVDNSTISLNQCAVEFDMVDVGDANNVSHMVVGIASVMGDMTTFTPIDTIAMGAVGSFTHHNVLLNSYSGYGQYLTFYTYTTNTSGTPTGYVCLDNVSLGRITSCQRADSLHTTQVSGTSATVGWLTSNMGGQYEIRYWPVGNQASAVNVLATTNPYTITGLAPATEYEWNVRTICSIGDTAYFSHTPGSFVTAQIPATLPWRCDFEADTQWANWQTISNSTINWYRGSAAYYSPTHAIYVSGDNGATNSTQSGTVNATAYRDVDFGSSDTSVMLRFKVRVGGSANGNYDGVGLFLEDPSTPLIVGTSNLMSPWGSLTGNHTCIEILHMDTLWTEHTYYFDSVSGVKRLGFYWYNQSMNSSSTGTFIGTPGAIDDITMKFNTCHIPRGLALGTVGETTASATWTAASGASYIFEYEVFGSGNPTSVATHSGSCTMQQLQPGTTYRCHVRRDCGADTSGWTDWLYFNTDYCPTGQRDTLGNLASTTTTNAYPISMVNAWSFTEMLYLANELNGPANVGQIMFNLSTAKPLLSRTNCTIMMGHTRRNAIPNSASFVPGDSLRVVYQGPLYFAHGWNSVVLDSQFVYNGQDNLIIAIDDNTGTISGQSHQFAATTRPASMTIQFYHDSYDPNPYNLSAYSGQRTASTIRPNIILGSCGTACPAPSLNTPRTTHDQARISWRAGGNCFEVCHKPSSETTWPAPTTVADTFTTINSLTTYTSYDYRVRQVCSSSASSEWVYGSFTTADAPCVPPANVRRFGSSRTSITVAWDRGGSENLWVARLTNNSYYDIDTVDGMMATFEGLQAGTSYNVMVRSLCVNHGDTVEGDWTEPIAVTTSLCKPVTNVRLTASDESSVTLAWTRGSNNTGTWEVEYGSRGYTVGNGGTSTITTDNPTTITGLTAGAELDFYVRAICDEGYVSVWSEPLHATVGTTDINTATAGAPQIALVPNPAHEGTTVSIAGIDGELTLTLHDINGRTVATHKLQCPGDCSKQLDLGHLAAGTYFVKITTSAATYTRKLVIGE